MSGRLLRALGVVLAALAGACMTAEAQTMKITSITFSAPSPLKAGDIITVDLAGTPGVRAAFSVKNLIPITHLKEVSIGSYHGSVKVPAGKYVRNAPLVGYLGDDNEHAAPVQASRLITVIDPNEYQPDKLPPIAPEPKPVSANPPAPEPPKQAAVDTAKPAPRPSAAVSRDKIKITSPVSGSALRRTILVKGEALPGSTVRVLITYNNGLSGMLRLAGEVASQDVAAGKNGEFKVGPIALDGPLATDGLRFTIKAYYPLRADHGTAEVVAMGKRD